MEMVVMHVQVGMYRMSGLGEAALIEDDHDFAVMDRLTRTTQPG
jgi:hypothetical protein